MSRFIQGYNDTETADLGPCQCPGTPHESDTAEIRTVLSGVDWMAIGMAADDSGTLSRAAILRMLNRGIRSWNLEDEDGPVPLDLEHLQALDADTTRLLAEACERIIKPYTLPNASGGRSRGGSPASGSRSRKAARTT